LNTILIVRLSAIGDIVMASPVAEALSKSYPEATILWLTQPDCAALVQDHPFVDEVIIWPRSQWQAQWRKRQFVSLFKSIYQFRKQLKSRNIDMAIDLQGLLKSGILAWLSGAKNKIGLGSKEGSQWLVDRVINRDSGNTDLIGSEYRWLCQQIGLKSLPWKMTVGASEQASKRANELITQTINTPYVVICPFTTRPQKHWSDASWLALTPKLTLAGLKVVMLGGPGDVEYARRLCQNSAIINLVGETKLTEAALIIQQAKALIGVDTGLTHMGHMHAIPTVALFGSTRPYLHTDTHNGKVIYHALHCSPCKRNPTCGGRFQCLTDISPDDIMAQLNPLLNDNSPLHMKDIE